MLIAVARVTCVVCADTSNIEHHATRSFVEHVGNDTQQLPRHTRAAERSRSCTACRGERSALHPVVLHGSHVMPMAGFEHLLCLMPAILCVPQLPPVATGPRAEGEMLRASGRAA